MTKRIVISLMAAGLFFQGCALQKRSIMPGWHVERLGRVSVISKASSPEVFAKTEEDSDDARLAFMPRQKATPIQSKSWRVGVPALSIASERENPRVVEEEIADKPQFFVELGVIEKSKSDLEPSEEERSLLFRTFMGLLAIALDLAIVPIVTLGFFGGGWVLPYAITLGVGLLTLSWFAWLAAFPKFRSRIRTWRNWEARQQSREEKGQARKSKKWWLTNLPLAILLATAILYFFSLAL